MIKTNCSCGAVKLLLQLSNDLSSYTPRACDCDFCMERKITYLSDPNGILTIECAQELNKFKQGSEQASFLACNQCNDIVAVICKFGNDYKGAINATLLNGREQLKMPQVASPKLLTAKEKLERWKSVWLTVEINYESNM